MNIASLPPSWRSRLAPLYTTETMQNLATFLKKQPQETTYPKKSLWFSALAHTPFEAVKVIILGQDPYHGEGQADGLSFSVPVGKRIPPSLHNIFKELESDLKITPPDHGCLNAWADQGVLLLNTTLTVEAGKPGSHQKQGWETVTDTIIQQLNQQRSGLVFMLWGKQAQKKCQYIDHTRHLVLQAAHPSPFSAYRGFFGCKHFSQSNQWLKEQGKDAINWAL